MLKKIREFLGEHGVSFREVHHAATLTSEESAQARGEALRIGGKALLLKTDGSFRVVVLSAALRLDSAALRREWRSRGVRFATTEELMAQTGLVPGSVPPFGRPILPFDLYVDRSILANEEIAFNAGSLTDSVILSVQDYLRVARPVLASFSCKLA